MKPDTIVKLRDAFTMASEALQEELESQAPKDEKSTPAVLEQTFTTLTYEKHTGDKLGEYETATEKNNVPDKFRTAINILTKSNATISHRYHGETYTFSYWIYDNRIFRQLLRK